MCVINLGAAGGGLLPIAGALKDILLVGVAAELLGTVGDVDDRCDVGDQRGDRDRGGGAGVERGVGHKDGLLLEVGEHLGKHAPNGQRKGAVLNPAALVPDKGGDGGRQQQRKAAEPGVGGQAVVGVAEVPDIVGDDVDPGHVGPQHVSLVLGGVDAPPTGHAEDVDDTGDAVEHVIPTGQLRGALGGDPGGLAQDKEVIGALEVGHDGDHDVDGHDHKRPRAEPMRLADLAPLVLNGNEAPATGKRRVYLGVVEPAVLIHMGGVGERPLGTLRNADGDGDAVDGHGQRSHAKDDSRAELGVAADLVEHDQADKDHGPADPVDKGIATPNIEQHAALLSHARGPSSDRGQFGQMSSVPGLALRILGGVALDVERRGDDFLDRLVGHIGVRADIHQQPHDEGVERLVDMVDA